jgi:methionine-rich copper-binding protein CopC
MRYRQGRPKAPDEVVRGGLVAAQLPRRGALPSGHGHAALLSIMVLLCVLLLGAAPASAHAELESSSPQDGATLTSAPASLVFTFGEELLDTGNAITLTPSGTEERLPLDEPEVDGPTISVPWPATAPAGRFTAAYRVVSADGHPVEGAITFTVKAATGETSSPSSAPSPIQAVSVPSGLPSAVASEPSPSASAEAAQAESSTGTLGWVLGLGAAALVAALAATWVIRRNRS